MNDDLELLASAYLDGDVTPDERAQVEADPELAIEVERLRQVRALLAAEAPTTISTRERHLAAALDAWDRLPETERTGAGGDITPAGLVAAPRPASLDARRQARRRTWILSAAAGLVVVLGGGIVLNSLGTGSSDDSASEAPLGASTDARADDEFGVLEERALQVEGDVAEEVAQDAAPDLAVAEADEPIGGAEAPPPEEDLANLTSLDDLAAFAASALDATTSQVDAPASTDAPSAGGSDAAGFDIRKCAGVDTVVGPASYNGVLVIVGIAEGRTEAVAHTPDDCGEIARARLP